MLSDAALVAFAATEDLDASHAFYGETLGLERTEAGEYANAYDVDGTQLRVTRAEKHVKAPYTVLGFNVPDIDAAIGELASRGVKFHRYPALDQNEAGIWTAPGGTRVAWFEDPDGNVLSIQQPAAG